MIDPDESTHCLSPPRFSSKRIILQGKQNNSKTNKQHNEKKNREHKMFSKSLLVAFTACAIIAACSTAAVSATSSAISVGPVAPATIGIDSSLFQEIASVIVPIINADAKKVVIPGGTAEGGKFTWNAFSFSQFDITGLNFNFVAPNEVIVTGSGAVGVNDLTFRLYEKVLFIKFHCDGKLEFSGDLSLTFSFRFIQGDDGKIVVTPGAAAQISLTNVQINLHFSEFVCKIASGIIDLFKHLIEKLIENEVDKLGGKIEGAVVGALQKIFEKVPVTLTGAPAVQGQVLALPIDLDSLVKDMRQQLAMMVAARGTNNNNKLQHNQLVSVNEEHSNHKKMHQHLLHAPPMLLSRHQRNRRIRGSSSRGIKTPFVQRDLSIVLPQTSINTVLGELASLGRIRFNTTTKLTTKLFQLLLPAAYAACPDCLIHITVDAPANRNIAPALIFGNNNATLVLTNLSLHFGAVPSNESNSTSAVVVPLFTLALSAELDVYNFTITTDAKTGVPASFVRFDLGAPNPITLALLRTEVGPVNTGILQGLANMVVNILLPMFNKVFPGMYVGAMHLDNLLLQITPGVFTAGFDLKL